MVPVLRAALLLSSGLDFNEIANMDLQNFTPEVKEKAAIYVPAIGKVTIAILLRNLLRLAQNQVQAALSSTPSAANGAIETTNGV